MIGVSTEHQTTRESAVTNLDETSLRDKIREALARELNDSEALYCSRDWSAWGHKTMTADDFSNYADDEDLMNQLVDAVMATLDQEG